MKESSLPLELLRRILDYDPTTGIFTWREAHSGRVAVGATAGVVAANGRRYIGVCGEKHSAHRLAWFYHYGKWPTANVRQRNGNYDDCRIDNLTDETATETARRGVLHSSNKSGIRGVCWSADKKKWLATITRDYKRLHLGYFDKIEDAEGAYQKAAEQLPDGIGTEIWSVESIARRRRIRAIWKRVLRQNHEQTGWPSFNRFIADVGEIPGEFYFVEKQDQNRIIGPDNFTWVERLPTVRAIAERKDRQARPLFYRRRQLKADFDLELEDFDQLLKDHGGVCAVCGEPETSLRGGRVKELAVDHDHSTDLIRGLLCSRCNPMIGFAKENAVRMTAAIEFVRLCQLLYETQQGKCAICGCSAPLLADRDFQRNVVRGLVCRDCKRMLTKSGNDPAKMRRAAEFLRHFRRVPGTTVEQNQWEPIPQDSGDDAENVVPFQKDLA